MITLYIPRTSASQNNACFSKAGATAPGGSLCGELSPELWRHDPSKASPAPRCNRWHRSFLKDFFKVAGGISSKRICKVAGGIYCIVLSV